jgi:hypothetical protein
MKREVYENMHVVTCMHACMVCVCISPPMLQAVILYEYTLDGRVMPCSAGLAGNRKKQL